ncbi:forkhead box protein B2-like [Copidosoma floridanum]|uniref:forkhead box protein B2-like n=1 Tax=Copidosoma floridanum TaxID=29053 RepID=UPI000C6F595E|nr:forkhead box protein B2-like [Copidosoma floridanum]
MLFVPFTVPSFPATHQQQQQHQPTSQQHQVAPQSHHHHHHHHQQLHQPPPPPPAGAQSQIVQQQPPPPPQLNHLNHQGTPTTNQPTIHSTSCSPQQQATTPNKEMKVNWTTSPGNQPKQDTSSSISRLYPSGEPSVP